MYTHFCPNLCTMAHFCSDLFLFGSTSENPSKTLTSSIGWVFGLAVLLSRLHLSQFVVPALNHMYLWDSLVLQWIHDRPASLVENLHSCIPLALKCSSPSIFIDHPSPVHM